MELLLQELEEATVVSIGHRPELARFHHRKIVLKRGRQGARLEVSHLPKRRGPPSTSASAVCRRNRVMRDAAVPNAIQTEARWRRWLRPPKYE